MGIFETASRKKLLTQLGLAGAFVLLTAFIVLRIGLVDRRVGTYIACPGCFHTAVARADLPLYALLAGLLLLASWLRPVRLGRVIHVLVGFILLIYLADLVVYRLFGSRLFLADVYLYLSEREAIWNQFMGGIGPLYGALLLAAVILGFAGLWCTPPAHSARQRFVLCGVGLAAMLAFLMLPFQPYVNGWAAENVFAANLASSERSRYSMSNGDRLTSLAPETVQVTSSLPGPQGRDRNVIVVILESWSSWHSKSFGGYEDWTPNLDDAARSGTRLTNFHSIGFSTDKGLVGILAGQPLWAPFLNWFETPPLHSMWGVKRTLPSVFNDAAYRTNFLTSGPLSLYTKGDWLTDLGFDYVEGNEHPDYTDAPRFAFKSASDQALYERAEKWRHHADQPYLLVLETVTTHQPFIDPDSGERSLEKALRYADRAFGDYFSNLKSSGFFENGVLLVVSDHRSMTPIPLTELELFGEEAHSKIPAFMIGEEFEAGANNHVFSQADLVPSFELWLSGSTWLMPFQGILPGAATDLSREVRARTNCAFHSRGDRRTLLQVVCPGGLGQVVLDGDQTHFARQEGLEPEMQQALLAAIAKFRLEGLDRHLNRNSGNSVVQ